MNGVVEAEEGGRWRALESSADSDGLSSRRQVGRLRERAEQRRAGLHGPGDLPGGQHPLVRRRAVGAEARLVS